MELFTGPARQLLIFVNSFYREVIFDTLLSFHSGGEGGAVCQFLSIYLSFKSDKFCFVLLLIESTSLVTQEGYEEEYEIT